MVSLRIPTAVQLMTGIERFKYQASDGYGCVIHTLFVRDFAAMGSSSFKGAGGLWVPLLFTASKNVTPSRSYDL